MSKTGLCVNKRTHMPYCVAQIGLRSVKMEISVGAQKNSQDRGIIIYKKHRRRF